jgi:chromosome segregation ATPase
MSFFQPNKLKEELEQVKDERDRLKAAINKFRNEFEQVKNEYKRLKTAMSDVERMEAYGLKKAIEVLMVRKKEIADEVATAELNAAKNRQILNEQISELNRQIAVKQTEIIQLDEEILLQSFGFYQPRYDLASSILYKSRLDQVRARQAKMVRDGTAAYAAISWSVNNSEKEGARMMKDYVKLILRSFNNECDASIVNVKFSNVNAIAKKIQKAFDVLNKLGEQMSISITQQYLELKLEELYLCHEYQIKRQQEKEEQKRIREQMREEARLLKEIEDARLKLEKEEKHFNKALVVIQEQIERAETEAERVLLEAEKDKIEHKLIEVTNNILTVEKREQNTRAGYVYIISNIGSFGENIYKIGVTRRLEPLDRVDELGDASVPFDFDVHALIFSDDAPALENALHRAFERRRLNMINRRREFFHVTLDEIETVVRTNFDKPVEFIRLAHADEYRQSLKLKEVAVSG